MQWPPPLRLGYPPGYPIPQKEPGPEVPYTHQKGPGTSDNPPDRMTDAR